MAFSRGYDEPIDIVRKDREKVGGLGGGVRARL